MVSNYTKLRKLYVSPKSISIIFILFCRIFDGLSFKSSLNLFITNKLNFLANFEAFAIVLDVIPTKEIFFIFSRTSKCFKAAVLKVFECLTNMSKQLQMFTTFQNRFEISDFSIVHCINYTIYCIKNIIWIHTSK